MTQFQTLVAILLAVIAVLLSVIAISASSAAGNVVKLRDNIDFMWERFINGPKR